MTIFHSFLASSTDGAGPTGGLTLGRDGNFYGTTTEGGSNDAGTIYQLTPAGACTTVYSFALAAGGVYPSLSRLTAGTDGSFYGMTYEDGSSETGTVFNLTLPVPPAITGATAAPATSGMAFSYQITATNSPTSYATSSIPPGLSFSTSTGKFTGTPAKTGTYKPLISATNCGGTALEKLDPVVKPPALLKPHGSETAGLAGTKEGQSKIPDQPVKSL